MLFVAVVIDVVVDVADVVVDVSEGEQSSRLPSNKNKYTPRVHTLILIESKVPTYSY